MGIGRPSKLTPEVQTRICDLVRIAVPKRTACLAVGIHKTTLYDWIDRGKAGEQPYADFLAAMDAAEAEAETSLVQSVQRGALDDPKLALDALRVRFHRNWNPAIKSEAKVQHSGTVGVQLYVPANGRDGSGDG